MVVAGLSRVILIAVTLIYSGQIAFAARTGIFLYQYDSTPGNEVRFVTRVCAGQTSQVNSNLFREEIGGNRPGTCAFQREGERDRTVATCSQAFRVLTETCDEISQRQGVLSKRDWQAGEVVAKARELNDSFATENARWIGHWELVQVMTRSPRARLLTSTRRKAKSAQSDFVCSTCWKCSDGSFSVRAYRFARRQCRACPKGTKFKCLL